MKKPKNTNIRQLKVEPGKPDAFIFDPSEPGFGARKYASGRVTLFAQLHGIGDSAQQRRVHLGNYVKGTLDAIREEAAVVIATVAVSLKAKCANWRSDGELAAHFVRLEWLRGNLGRRSAAKQVERIGPSQPMQPRVSGPHFVGSRRAHSAPSSHRSPPCSLLAIRSLGRRVSPQISGTQMMQPPVLHCSLSSGPKHSGSVLPLVKASPMATAAARASRQRPAAGS